MVSLFEIELPFPGTRCVLKLLEPQGSCAEALWQRVCDRTYEKPFIMERGTERLLYFDVDSSQSVMSLEQPNWLTLAYTRTMMAFLLFNRSPRRILLLGLGGGSLAKFCYRTLPLTAITAVEVNPHVIALRDQFCIPKDDERFRVVHADSAAYVSETGCDKDVILADACDHAGIAPAQDTIEFYQDVWRRLTAAGVFVLNLCGDRARWVSHVAKLRSVFGERFITLPAQHDGNVILFAFKQISVEMDWRELEATGRELARRYGFDFQRYVQRIALDWRLRRQRPRSINVHDTIRQDCAKECTDSTCREY